MNEKIKELAEDAGVLAGDWVGCMYAIHNQEEVEQFAELLINECVRIIHEQERIPKEYFYPKSAHTHEYAIKKYFGLVC